MADGTHAACDRALEAQREVLRLCEERGRLLEEALATSAAALADLRGALCLLAPLALLGLALLGRVR